MAKLREINSNRVKDKESLTLAIAAQEKKISNIQKAEAEKRHQNEQRIMQERLAATSQMFGNLAVLSQSGNKSLATIGKASAIAQTTIDTYVSAQKAFSALAGIPIIGPALGAAAAAAAIIAGLARVQQIRGVALQEGITDVPGVGKEDQFNAVLAPHERVVDADTNSDLKDFLEESRGSKEILEQINENIINLENQIHVNIGGDEIINSTVEASRSGRRIGEALAS